VLVVALLLFRLLLLAPFDRFQDCTTTTPHYISRVSDSERARERERPRGVQGTL